MQYDFLNCTLLLLLLPTYVISIQNKIEMELLKLQNIQHVAAPFLCSKPGRQPSELLWQAHPSMSKGGRLRLQPSYISIFANQSQLRSTASRAPKRKPRQGLLPKGYVSHG